MKSRLLLFLLVLTVSAMAASAQTFHIEWNEADTIRGPIEKGILKRTGDIVNDNGTQKNLLFTFDMNNMNLDHLASICFSANCFFLFPGPDDPSLRPEQVLPGDGTLEIYADMDPSGVEGASTVVYSIWDKDNPETEKIEFSCTYIFGPVASVEDARERGFSVGPVPSTDQVTVRGDGTMLMKGANLYSADGNLLRTYGASGSAQTFNLSGLSSGTYHLMLTMTDGSVLRAPISVLR